MANAVGGQPQQGTSTQGAQQGEGWQQTLQDQVSRLSDQVQWQSSQLADMAQGGIREWPMTAVLGAFAAGLAIGLMLGGAGVMGMGERRR